jgi:chorismate-pyruvate lyase
MPDSHAYPLSEFYAHAKLPIPRIEVIPGEAVPEPYQKLLVHDNDMTPTLENFHKGNIHLEILNRERRGDFYYRQVVLRMTNDERAVEFGANKIYIGRFPEDAQQLILAEEVPLGRILDDFKVPHSTKAKAFLRLQADDVMNNAFGLQNSSTLFGRKAIISGPDGRPLSEIVEILPPLAS